MFDRESMRRGAVAILACTLVSLLFIASYAGALHEPEPHGIPIAVAAPVPATLAARLDATEAFEVTRVPDAAAALRRINRREDYGAIVATAQGGLQLVLAPAASPAVATVLQTGLAPRLGRNVQVRVVHPLPASDGRGLVAFYLAVGWVVGGYLGASLFGLAFGTSPARIPVLRRVFGLFVLGVNIGLGGALIARAIANYDRGLFTMTVFGILTVLAVGLATLAFQRVLGLAGTGLAILLFVIIGNPAGGGPYATELLPGFWRVLGPFLPPGAATTAVRNAAYFPDASQLGPMLVLWGWILIAVIVALALGGRGHPLEVSEEEAAAAAAAAAAA
jgi:hypothetical protein